MLDIYYLSEFLRQRARLVINKGYRIVTLIVLTLASHNKKMLASGAAAIINDEEIDNDDGHDDDFNERS